MQVKYPQLSSGSRSSPHRKVSRLDMRRCEVELAETFLGFMDHDKLSIFSMPILALGSHHKAVGDCNN